MRRVEKYLNNNKSTVTYVKLSDVHREFGEWCKVFSKELVNVDDISKEYFHYFVNLLPSVELGERNIGA